MRARAVARMAKSLTESRPTQETLRSGSITSLGRCHFHVGLSPDYLYDGAYRELSRWAKNGIGIRSPGASCRATMADGSSREARREKLFRRREHHQNQHFHRVE
jgi:hypothetical protein